MLLIDCELRVSAIEGLGLFCVEPVPKDTLVWVFDERYDIEVDESVVSTLPSAARKFLHRYGYKSVSDSTWIVNMDLSRHMNHSELPNLYSDEKSNYYASSDLPAGTELTCNYRAFATEGCIDGFLGVGSQWPHLIHT